jgi:cation diffusion facilitator family transporter
MGHGHHHHDHFHLPAGGESARLMKLATTASVAMATFLLLAKLVAWWRSDSLAMLSSATDSFFDVMSSGLNLVAVRYALKPADDDHRFGHTSIEDIAGLAQCAFISASMFIIILQSLERLSNPVPLTHAGLGIAVSVLGMVFTTVLVAYQTYVTRKTKSLVVHADRLHYAGDVAFNFGVLVSLFLSMHFGWGWADPAMALLIAAVVLWSSRSIGIRAFNNLMDRELPDDEKQKIHEAAAAIPAIRGYHNLKTRYSGNKAFIQMHVEMDGALDFREVHDIVDRLEHDLQHIFPGAEVIVHPDPFDVLEEKIDPQQFPPANNAG